MANIAFEKLPPLAKYLLFYGAFAALFILYGIIVVGFYLHLDISESTMESLASWAPIVLKELSIPGELVPAVLGGLMAWTAPSRAANAQVVFLLLLSAIAWIMYLHMQIVFSTPEVRDYLLSGSVGQDHIVDTLATLSSFANNVRSFAAVVFAAILGLRFNDNQTVLLPAKQAPEQPAVAAVPPPVAPGG